MCEDRVWVRQFQHQKALIWNISFFLLFLLHLFTYSLNFKKLCSVSHISNHNCQPATKWNYVQQLNHQLQAAPTKSWKEEDKLCAKRTTGNSKQKKVANISFVFGRRRRCFPRVFLRACVSELNKASRLKSTRQTPYPEPGTTHHTSKKKHAEAAPFAKAQKPWSQRAKSRRELTLPPASWAHQRA